jgi:hypothetical protein
MNGPIYTVVKRTYVGVDLRRRVLRLSVVFEIADDLVNDLDIGMAFSLRIADFFRIAATFGDEVVSVE